MRLLRLLLLILVIPTVSAAFDPVIETIKVGEKMDYYERVLELLSVSGNGQILVRIDNLTTRPVLNSTTIDGVKVQVLEVFYTGDPEEGMAKINMTVQWQHLCDTDADCDEDDICVIRKCTGWPRRCDYPDSAKNITTCAAGDGCCPPTCNWLNDEDCLKECHKDRDCDDDDPGTIDQCTGTVGDPGHCEHIAVTECKSMDDFCPVGCEYGYRSGQDADCSENNTCSYDSDCPQKTGLTAACIGYGTDDNPRQCVYSNVTECVYNDGFCPLGCDELSDNDCPHEVMCGDGKCESPENCETCEADCGCSTGLVCSAGECMEEVRVCDDLGARANLSIGGEFYCTEGGWRIVKAGGSVCKNDYECKSTICGSNGKCVSVTEVKEKQNKKFALTLLGVFLVVVAVYFAALYTISKKAKKF